MVETFPAPAQPTLTITNVSAVNAGVNYDLVVTNNFRPA